MFPIYSYRYSWVFVLLVIKVFFFPVKSEAQILKGDFSELAEELLPSVVNISTTQGLEGNGDLPVFPPGSPIEKLNEFLGTGPRLTKSLGSGFIIRPEGIIVTNNHVIEDAETIEIAFSDGTRTRAEVIGHDPTTDIAVLKVNVKKQLKAVSFADSDQIKVGQWVLAIGNPLGYGGSVSAGIISARNRDIRMGSYDDFIQTDVAINQGNSGGPLFNMEGKVVGVNTAILSPTGYSIGISFTTASNLVHSVVEQILKYGETKRGWLGVRVQPVSYEIALTYGLEEVRGALIKSVAPKGAAFEAGLKPGDLILRYNGDNVSDDRALSRFAAETLPGTKVKIEYMRGHTTKTVNVTLKKLPQQSSEKEKEEKNKTKDLGEKSILGLGLVELNNKIRARYSLSPETQGVLVVSIDKESPAFGKIIEGDVIEQIAWQDTTSLSQFEKKVKILAKSKDPVLIMVNRQGEQLFHSIRLKTE